MFQRYDMSQISIILKGIFKVFSKTSSWMWDLLQEPMYQHSLTVFCSSPLWTHPQISLFIAQDAEIIRTRDPALLAECDVVVDVGGEFDPKRHRYDHHQRYSTDKTLLTPWNKRCLCWFFLVLDSWVTVHTCICVFKVSSRPLVFPTSGRYSALLVTHTLK